MSPNAPDNDLDQMEQAQAALRDGIERARKLVRDAKRVMREGDGAQPEPPTTFNQSAGAGSPIPVARSSLSGSPPTPPL